MDRNAKLRTTSGTMNIHQQSSPLSYRKYREIHYNIGYKEREEENRRLEDFDYHPEAQPVQEADEIYSDLNSERCELRSEDDLEYNPLDGLYSSSEINTSSVIESDQENNLEIERGGSIEGTSEVDHTNTGQYAPEDKLILYEVIRAFDLVDQMHGSHSDFNDLLEFARDLYCKDDVGLRQNWPKDYRAAKKLCMILVLWMLRYILFAWMIGTMLIGTFWITVLNNANIVENQAQSNSTIAV